MSWEDILKAQGPLSDFIADLLYDFPDAELSVAEQTRGFMARELRQEDSPDSKKESDSMQILRIVRNIPLELQNKLVAPIVNIFRYRYIQGVGEYFGAAPNINYQRQHLPTSVNVNSGPPNFGSIYTKAEIKDDDVFEFQLTTNNPYGLTTDEGDIITILIKVKNLARDGGRVIGKQTERRKKFREIAHMRLKRLVINNQVRPAFRR
mgnify:CR=1 FL=1